MFVILDLNNWSLENNVFFTKNNSTCYWAQVGHLAGLKTVLMLSNLAENVHNLC